MSTPIESAAGARTHVSSAVRREAGPYCEAFQQAKPFKHVVIEDFFEPDFAERLLAEFPSFDPNLSINEGGEVGGKAVNPEIRQISPAYMELYETISGKPFLDLVSELCGIPDLILDPAMFGGGTHENLHGQELDPHVDFNYDESQQLHRRLNLIVYLNKGWQHEWGGAIEIHSNPREPYENQVHSYDPLFNRCVMFETNEYSWHGFRRIDLPADKRQLSRKSISIYLYTKDRPAEEIAPAHGTFYVQRFLPEHIKAGHRLTQEDVDELSRLLLRRDNWIALYQRMELEKNGELAKSEYVIEEAQRHLRAPLVGYMKQEGAIKGFYFDGWVRTHSEIPIRPQVPVSGVVVRGWRPEKAPEGTVRLSVDDTVVGEFRVGGGAFELNAKFPHKAQDLFRLKIDIDAPGNGLPPEADPRDLAMLIAEVRARHPLTGALSTMTG